MLTFLFLTSNASMELKQVDAGLHKSIPDGFHDCLFTVSHFNLLLNISQIFGSF